MTGCERVVHDLPTCTRRRRHMVVSCPKCGQLFRAEWNPGYQGDGYYEWKPVTP